VIFWYAKVEFLFWCRVLAGCLDKKTVAALVETWEKRENLCASAFLAQIPLPA
jgi:hypothetical protein